MTEFKKFASRYQCPGCGAKGQNTVMLTTVGCTKCGYVIEKNPNKEEA